MLYADDLVLLARNQMEFQVMMDVVEKYAMKWRFRFNSKKSKTMLVGGKGSGGEWRINEVRMEKWKYSSILECDLVRDERKRTFGEDGEKAENGGQELAV